MEGDFFRPLAVDFTFGFRNEAESFKRKFFGLVAHLSFFNDGADVGEATMFMFVRELNSAEGTSNAADKFVLKMHRSFELGKDAVQNGVCFLIVHADHAH